MFADLAGKKVLVTGATGGIGQAIASRLSQEGCQLLLSGTRQEKLTELNNALGGKHQLLATDLGDTEAVEALCGQASEMLGGLDILICNAGITSDGLAIRMKTEDFDKVLNINLRAAFILNREAIKLMMKQRSGKIVNITSVVGFTGNPGQANYVASKAGLVGMSKSLAAETASRNININCIAPGFIATPMTDVLTDTQKAAILQNIPQQKMGTPEDIANGVAFLVSAEANYITGTTLHINGGLFM